MSKKNINAYSFNKDRRETVIKYVFSIFVTFVITSIVVALFGNDPFKMFYNLFKGALVGKLNFGTMLEKLTTTLLLATAFNVCRKVGYVNLGLEGSLYLGALTYAVIGYHFPNLPGYIYLSLCIICSMIIGGLWGLLPAILKAKWNVNEICVTLLLNYAVIRFCTYAVYYVWTAKTSIPQTPELCPQVQLPKILLPSRANVGLFISIAVYIVVMVILFLTATGRKVQSVGENAGFAEYIGVNAKKTMLVTVFLGGAVAGLAGALEVGGLYGRFVDEFASGAAFTGLLASRLVNNNIVLIPISSILISILQAGAYGVERTMGIARTFIDAFTALIIMMLTIDDLYGAVRSGIQKIIARFKKEEKMTEEM